MILSYHSVHLAWVPRAELENENLEALANGIVNLEKHIENIQKYGVPVVVALNSFVSDTY